MPGIKEIRIKIASFKSTQKITKAMKMVAASKMRRAQERMSATRPYSEKIRRVIGHLRHANPDFKHPFLVERPAKSVGFIIISTDRGLCGGLNVNLFKTTLAAIRDWQKQGVDVSVCLIGAKAVNFFRRLSNVKTLATVTHLGDRPHVADLIGTVKVMLDLYREGKLDRLFVVNNVLVNTMTQKPTVRQLLPVAGEESEDNKLQKLWDYIYEPSAAELLDGVLMRYIESQVYQGAVENVACEMAARMVAMQSATDNAGKLIEELQLIYNKARQASITKEISEIVGGAAAV
ncbi:F-type H+-transporting ATPase subunit gamma [Povalibacter uvarum]|uniref:ATP synthase gamma chain n=1 Tax=Povalibacter uvarum TaxID=732238 RepID=A0A841HIV5_9GAMM|nr:F0F1 ATP synthase subunit gamma [Povalibacter uvarum]MBB6093131.1 F-type H+-transporting ATPase subunit gamma [Povalibacter uvarum]